MSKKYVFGAGRIGRHVSRVENDICAFIDNSPEKWGGKLSGKRIYSFEEYLKLAESDDTIIIAAQASVAGVMEKQLAEAGILNYIIWKKEKIISFCPEQSERGDVILYHVLHDVNNIFYIDVGANDPMDSSVTKFLYAFKDAHGINIEPQIALCELLKKDRSRDVNLCVACGAKHEKMELYLQSGYTTLVRENVKLKQAEGVLVDVVPLTEICDHYVGEQEIHFLKVDVEGFEAEVLKGCNFEKYRPWIISLEEEIDLLDKPSSSVECEEILRGHGYHYVYQNGYDRYYLADEHLELKQRFLPVDELDKLYDITYVE